MPAGDRAGAGEGRVAGQREFALCPGGVVLMSAMEKTLIIIHPGSAHFDEMTAVSLILAMRPGIDFAVERREPATAELDDPNVWVIDIGGRHEPRLHNFDHHQSLDCPASFVLLARYLDLEETMRVLPWWDFKDNVDRFGPVKSSRLFGAGDDLVNRNPVEVWLTRRFAADPEGTLPLLKSFGEEIVEYARKLKKQIDFWQSCEVLKIGGVPAIIGETRESAGLEEFRRLTVDPPYIVISRDRRDEGWRLFRFEGTPVDFTRIADDPRVKFAHKSGFLAKTATILPVPELLDLVAGAVIAD